MQCSTVAIPPKTAEPSTKFTRAWSMPSSETFSIAPIRELIWRYLPLAEVSVDPFARNSNLCTYTNDLNPRTTARHHLDATEFLHELVAAGVKSDLVLFDPPYSPRQLQECYEGIGRSLTQADTQQTWSDCRDAIDQIVGQDGAVISCGWDSVGMGKKFGFEIEEILLVCHGVCHHDTIVVAERRVQAKLW